MQAITVRPGYLEGSWTPGLGPQSGEMGRDGVIRKKVGAAHYPLADLLNAFRASGFAIDQFAEGFAPTPLTLSVRLTAVT